MGTIAEFEKHLSDLGVQLEQTRVRRLKTLHEIRRVHALAEGGNKNALLGLGPLRKSSDDDGRLVLSIEREIDEQSAAAAIKRHVDESASLPRDKWFEVTTPDGRVVRHKHHSLDALRAEVLPGYKVTAQIFGMRGMACASKLRRAGDDEAGFWQGGIGGRRSRLCPACGRRNAQACVAPSCGESAQNLRAKLCRDVHSPEKP